MPRRDVLSHFLGKPRMALLGTEVMLIVEVSILSRGESLMKNFFFCKKRPRIFADSNVWRGPKVVISHQLIKDGIPLKNLGIGGDVCLPRDICVTVMVTLHGSGNSQG